MLRLRFLNLWHSRSSGRQREISHICLTLGLQRTVWFRGETSRTVLALEWDFTYCLVLEWDVTYSLVSGWNVTYRFGFGVKSHVPFGFGVRGHVPFGFGVRRHVQFGFRVRRHVPFGFRVRCHVPFSFGVRCYVPFGFGVRRDVPIFSGDFILPPKHVLVCPVRHKATRLFRQTVFIHAHKMDSRRAVSFRPFDPCSSVHVHSHEPHIPLPRAAALMSEACLTPPPLAPLTAARSVTPHPCSAGYLVTPLWAVLRRHWKRGEDNSKSLFL